MDSGALPAQLVKTLDHIVIAKWMDMATATVIAYEWLITLHMEVRYVWNSRWSLTKVMYLLNRYLVVADFVINHFRSNGVRVPACKQLVQATIILYICVMYVAEYNLALRVCVVWRMNKIIIALLAAIYTATFIYVLVSFYRMLSPVVFFTLLPLGGCLANIENSPIWIYFTILTGYDAIMLALMAYPTIKKYRFKYMQTAFVKHTYVEGTLFYVYLLLIDVISVTVQQMVPDDIFLFVLSTRMLRSILAARVVLHLRENSERKVLAFGTNPNNGTTVQTELSELRFN